MPNPLTTSVPGLMETAKFDFPKTCGRHSICACKFFIETPGTCCYSYSFALTALSEIDGTTFVHGGYQLFSLRN